MMHFSSVDWTLLVLLCALYSSSCRAEYRHYINKGSDVNTNCGCPPDAAVATMFDTRAYVFSENSFWFYDLFEDSDSIAYTQLNIEKEFPGLPSNLDAAVNVFRDFLFVKADSFWVYNANNRFVAFGNTSNWINFPEQVDAMNALRLLDNQTQEIKVISDQEVYICNATSEYTMVCSTSVQAYDEQEQQVGFPVQAAVTLGNGVSIIFGTDFMCIVTPPDDHCILLCHLKIFPCPHDAQSTLILVAIVALMFAAWLLVGLFFCEAIVNSTSAYRRRGF